MKQNEQRRKSKRYKVKWKAAVVFDPTAKKPIVHTQTQDISAGGVAIHSEHGDLTGTVVTLLLAQPPMMPGDPPKMMKVKARVVCTFQTPGTAGYRHGLSFERAPGDGLDDLETMLQLHAPEEEPMEKQPANQPATAQPAQTPAAAPAAAPQPSAEATMSMAPGGSRLERLKAAAAAKAAEPVKVDPQVEINNNVSGALQRIYTQFKEIIEPLNQVNDAYPSKGYAMAGVPEFSDFVWIHGNVSLQTREISLKEKLWTRARLDFRVGKMGAPLKITKDFPASDKLHQTLKELKIEYTTKEERNPKGALVRVTFTFPAEVKISLNFEGNFETGKLLLTMRNIGTYGMAEYVINPLSVTHESMDELVGYMLGETKTPGSILQNA
jgi:hypothetical protein